MSHDERLAHAHEMWLQARAVQYRPGENYWRRVIAVLEGRP